MSSKKVTINKKNFADLLITSTQQAFSHAKGKTTLKSESLELPNDPPSFSKKRIKKIREQILDVSQPVFASILACSPSTIKSWERGENTPGGPARRLLQLIENNPQYFLENLYKFIPK